MRLIACLAAALLLPAAYPQSYTISTVAGAGVPTNVPGKSTGLGYNTPEYLTADPAGNVYFVDQNSVVRMDAKTGQLSIFAGNGNAGYSGDNGPATAAQLNGPRGLTLDAAGNLYIADTGNYVIREVSQGIVTTIAGNGNKGTTCANGPAASVQFRLPVAVAVDNAGDVYIADTSNSCVRKLSKGMVTTVAGTGTPGFSGNGGAAASSMIGYPQGLALDAAGNLYFADPRDSRVFEVTAGTGILQTVVGNGQCCAFTAYSGNATQAELEVPVAVAVDASGNLYVSDAGANAVIEIANGIIATVAGYGGFGFGGDGQPAKNSKLNGPGSIAFDAAGNLYIADQGNGRIREVSTTGVIDTIAGTGQNGDNGPATAAQFDAPSFVAVDAADNLYISDGGAFVVRKVTAASGLISTVAGNGTGDFGGVTNGAAATSVSLLAPDGLAVDAAGTLYLADDALLQIFAVSNGTLSVIAGSGQQGVSFDGPALSAQILGAFGLAVDGSRNLFFADTSTLLGEVGGTLPYNPLQDHILEVSHGEISNLVGNGTRGSAGDGGLAVNAQILGPYGVATDAAGNVYFSDSGNYKVRKVTVATGILSTVAGNGQSGFSGDGGPATAAALGILYGVAVDKAGNIYISDAGNSRIRKVSAATGIITTIAGDGTAGFGGDYGPATSASLAGPAGIAVDSTDNVFFVDGTRVRVLTPSTGTGAGPVVSLVINAEGGASAIAPNTWVEINGTNLAPAGDSRAWQGTDFANGSMPTNLDGVSVTVNGQPAYVYYISPTQVNILTPPGALPGSVQVVLTNGTPSAPFTAQAQAASPSFFVFNGGPYICATHVNGSLIGPPSLFAGLTTPATRGETIVIYANGFGTTSTPVVAGAESQTGTLSPTPTITIGGVAATVQFAGLSGAPGEFQFNVMIPSTLAAGDQAIVATYNGMTTQLGTLVTVQ